MLILTDPVFRCLLATLPVGFAALLSLILQACGAVQISPTRIPNVAVAQVVVEIVPPLSGSWSIACERVV